MGIISVIVSIYYNVIMGYTLHYMFASWTWQLPWETCNPDWADARCYVRNSSILPLPTCKTLDNLNITSYQIGTHCTNLTYQTAAEQYWL